MKTNKANTGAVFTPEQSLRIDLLKTRDALSKLCQVEKQVSTLRFNLKELNKLNLINISKVFVETTHLEQVISSLSKEAEVLVESIKQHSKEV